jgi:alkylation response protein AidB-like acyl-CoA dehydrogenase
LRAKHTEEATMDVTFDESEVMLRDTARHLAESLACKSVANFESFDRDAAWTALASAGFLGLRVPEDHGGGGGSTVDASIVVEALGRSLLPVPYLGTAALTAELLIAAGASSEVLQRLVAGDLRLSVGLTFDLSSVAVLGQTGDIVSFDGAGADGVLVLGADNKLVAVAPGHRAVALDITRETLRGTPDQLIDIGHLGGELPPEALARFHARALSLLAADLVGVMSAALDTAVAYAAGRVQFGVPIGTFQAVQHLAADQLVSLEGARSLAEYAAWAADELETGDALEAAYCAKAYCTKAGRTLCEAAIQIHGGMGITWDCMAHLYLKRALVDGLVFGDHAHNISLLAELRGRRAA